MTGCTGTPPAAALARLTLALLLGTCMLLTLGATAPGGTDSGPTMPAVTAGTVLGACEEHERPREGVGHSHIRLRCTISDTRPLKTPDDHTQLYLDHRRARAAVHPRGHDGRPRATRIRAVGDTSALLQVFLR